MYHIENFRADLHIHSCFSDGTDSPEDLVKKVLEANLQGFSITDHDTLQAYSTVFDFADKSGIYVLPGVELSASYNDTSVHVLGYAFNLNNEEMHALCKRHMIRRKDRNEQILKKLRGLGINISDEELCCNHLGTIGRLHIARILHNKNVVVSVQDAFNRYLGEGKPAYSAGEHISVLETIKTIKGANGKAILAHPHLLPAASTVRNLMKLPFDGLEGYYAHLSTENGRWVRLAKENGWLCTGGSDYHGFSKPFNVIGSSWVDRESFFKLYDHYLSNAAV